jgi:drug/metabolite transporter (DMT)-like permease
MSSSSAATTADAPPALTAQPDGLAVSWADGAALLTVFSWGVSFPITKALMLAVSPLLMASLRAALSALLLIAVLALAGRVVIPSVRDLGWVALVGLVGTSLNGVLYNLGLNLTTATHTGLIYTLTPLFVFGLSYALGRMGMVRRDLLGLGLGAIGGALIVGGPLLAGGDNGGASLLGDLLIVGAMITFGLWAFLAEPLIRRYGALATTTWVTIAGAIGLLPVGLLELPRQDWTSLSVGALTGLLYIGLIVGGASVVLWYWAVGRIGSARTVVYANLESFFAVLAAAVLLAERIELTAVLGGVAVIGGVVLTRRQSGEGTR